jgi:hypothetical protein
MRREGASRGEKLKKERGKGKERKRGREGRKRR